VAENHVNEATVALRALSSKLQLELLGAYASETGLPTVGLHRKTMDHAFRRFAVTCDSCSGTGLQMIADARSVCTDCGGLKSRLSPAAVRRLHQIVVAAFPEVRPKSNVEKAAKRWEARKPVTVFKPVYLGSEDLPVGVPPRPNSRALPVASIKWRRGLRSEFLWTAGEADLCVLWERLPDLKHSDGEPWAEVFAWASGGVADPGRSVQRLLLHGWAAANPAYDWLDSLQFRKSSRLRKAFTVTAGGLLSEQQLEWLFAAAARARSKATAQRRTSAKGKVPLVDKPLNIGPYSAFTAPLNCNVPTLPAALGTSVAKAMSRTDVNPSVLPFRPAGKNEARQGFHLRPDMKLTSADLVRMGDEWWERQAKTPNGRGFTLTSGRAVLLTQFHMEGTSLGLREGTLQTGLIDELLIRMSDRMNRLWGRRATYFIRPISGIGPEIRPGLREVRFPHYCYHALLTSRRMDERSCGSELVVMWFGEQEQKISLLGMVEQACRDVPWEAYARNYDGF
jgi:hypothetical protein